MQLELNFFSTSYLSVRAKTPLNARVYMVSDFQNNFPLKFFFTENHDFWSFLVIFGKNCKKVFFSQIHLSIDPIGRLGHLNTFKILLSQVHPS
jgi:hypothetical protein